MYILCTSWHILVYTFWYWYMQCTVLVYTSTCMHILSTVNVHTDFNPITAGFRGKHRDAELSSNRSWGYTGENFILPSASKKLSPA